VFCSLFLFFFFFSSRRRHTRFSRDWSSDVCSSDLGERGHLVMYALDMAQIRQDEGYSWAEAIEEAINILEYDMQDDQRCNWWNRSEERRVGKEWRSRWRQDE